MKLSDVSGSEGCINISSLTNRDFQVPKGWLCSALSGCIILIVLNESPPAGLHSTLRRCESTILAQGNGSVLALGAMAEARPQFLVDYAVKLCQPSKDPTGNLST